ncbi:SDR family oxidoreductase [Parahaliea maris]|uniref:SDR family oxidoreductase n=1 Tax=Parahaliea maris TaxID=2716870 RepID=A0A5C8ZYS1_9GAMM|nr:SDR family oxidoreductase [Parahaliea maris]TXS92959.1 SDR family oxidoreductase [Parahaliea maris]
MSLEGKVAVLTGACGGIGKAITRTFVSQGARVLATDLSAPALADLQQELGDSVATMVLDVSDFTAVTSAMDRAVETFGTLDVVMNNAGTGAPKLLLEHEPAQDYDPITAVNQNGVYYGILAAGRKFVELDRPGVIVNTSSVYGTMASELTFSYNVSKAAVDMMTKCAALEFAPHNIRVCAVAPGRVNTPIIEGYKALGLLEHITREQMRERLIEPEEIARVVAFLASDEAGCINGTTVEAGDGFSGFKYPLTQRFASA